MHQFHDLPAAIARHNIPTIYGSAGGRYHSWDEYSAILTDATLNGHNIGYPFTANPLAMVLETKLALWEKAEKTLFLSNGMAAIATAIMSFAHYGEYIIAPFHLYGTTEILLAEYLPTFGIRVERADFKDLELVQKQVRPQTKVMFVEIPSHPFLDIVDIAACAKIAHQAGAILIVDNSLASPAGFLPLAWGADLVVGSIGSYLGGQEPLGYIGGSREYVLMAANYAWVTGQAGQNRNIADILHNLATFPLRMAKHTRNAWEVAKFLATHPAVETIWYPGLSNHPDYRLAQTQMTGVGSTITIKLKSDTEGIFRIFNNLKVCYVSSLLGDASTCLEHPASMSYLGVAQKKKEALGISGNLVRISVGLEETDVILRDIAQALRKV